MAVKQVEAHVQNDGNYCQLDLQDRDFGRPFMRIETFRCSQPIGPYGITGAGTRVEWLAGKDHLTPTSNQIFRHIFCVGDTSNPQSTLEIRETFDEDGSWEVRTRDLDPESASFGYVLVATVKPRQMLGKYHLHYEVRKPSNLKRTLVTSPLTAPITELVPELNDLGAPLEELGIIDTTLNCNPLDGEIDWCSDASIVDAFFNGFAANFQREPLLTWAKNVQAYERFGDFRDKCVHPGINLIGSNPGLASEYLLIRAYRGSLILIGRVCDPDMAEGGLNLWEAENPLDIDPKPGVYSVFLSAYILNIGIYQLGIDKVHSDYGGVPMTLTPGSKLETGISPIVDSTRANQTLAELAVAFYVGPKVARLLAKEEAREAVMV